MHFDVCELRSNYGARVQYLFDSWLPDPGVGGKISDHEKFSDAAVKAMDAGLVVFTGTGTSSDDDDDDNEEADVNAEDEDDIFGVAGILLFTKLQRVDKQCASELVTLLSHPTKTVTDGTELSTLFSSGRGAILMNEHMRNLPPQLTFQVVAAATNDFVTSSKKPDLVLVLGKAQLVAGDDQHGQKAEKQWYFWRDEDEALFAKRDKRVAVNAYKCPPMFDGQSDSDVPWFVVFGVSLLDVPKILTLNPTR